MTGGLPDGWETKSWKVPDPRDGGIIYVPASALDAPRLRSAVICALESGEAEEFVVEKQTCPHCHHELSGWYFPK